MGIAKPLFKVFIKLHNEGYLKGVNSVMELGSQDMGAYPEDIKFFLRSIGKDENELINTYKKQGGRTIKEIIRRNSTFSGRIIYEWLGINEYECIDSDGKWNAKILDLNEDIQKKYDYKKQFDLTTNHGTSEHVFNQYMFFKNMHDLTKNKGYMMHGIPIKVNFNHCFYNILFAFATINFLISEFRGFVA